MNDVSGSRAVREFEPWCCFETFKSFALRSEILEELSTTPAMQQEQERTGLVTRNDRCPLMKKEVVGRKRF
jgi:hypothetical protein